jgi:hypothetical protein
MADIVTLLEMGIGDQGSGIGGEPATLRLGLFSSLLVSRMLVKYFPENGTQMNTDGTD